MVEKVKKTIPWFLILVLISMVAGINFNFWKFEVKANETATTTVTVGNSAPDWVGEPIEDPASATGSPTNAGTNVTFKAKANDPNDEDYFLIICKTTGYTTTSDGTCASCDGGASDTWATSSATTDNTTSTVTYTTQGGDSESNAWYAYVCDANVGSQLCSSASQGTGDSGSPFIVNHSPSFTVASNTSPQDPGISVTWNTTSSDSDTVGGNDTVKLIVCKDNSGITNDECDGGASDTWCTSTYSGSDASCAYTIPIPTDDDASPYAAYVYIVDNHYFAATGGSQGTASSYTVNNVAPSISSVKLNMEEDINLIEGNTTSTQVTGIISDDNGDADISSGTAKAYRSGVGAVACTSQNDNQCYYNLSCNLDSSDGDTSRNATCTVSIWYNADPTGANTPWAAENWLATLEGQDDNTATGTDETGTSIEIIALSALDIDTGAISYGTIGAGEKRNVNVTSTVVATGNCALDTNLSGTDMTGAGTITADNQKYATTTGDYDTTGTALSTGAVEFELNLAKTTNRAATSSKDIYWGLNIPIGKPAGAYSGQNTFGAVKDELPWP